MLIKPIFLGGGGVEEDATLEIYQTYIELLYLFQGDGLVEFSIQVHIDTLS